MAKLSFFNYWNVIIGKEEMTEEHWESMDSCYSKWMMNKLISNDLLMLQCCDIMSRFNNIPNRVHFKAVKQYYKEKIGNRKLYINYSKATKPDEDVEIISDYYNVSISDAYNYRDMISDDELNMIRELKAETNKLLNEKITKSKGRKTDGR
jgi:hypothetical protein